jgi:hypothetical protein
MLNAAIRSLNQNWATNSPPAISRMISHAPLRKTSSAATTTTYSRPIMNIVSSIRLVNPRSGAKRVLAMAPLLKVCLLQQFCPVVLIHTYVRDGSAVPVAHPCALH